LGRTVIISGGRVQSTSDFQKVRGLSLDRLLVLVTFVGVAGVQRIALPFQHLVIELQLPEQFGELLFQRFLAHIVAAAGGMLDLACP
jgi:hypothetical protein